MYMLIDQNLTTPAPNSSRQTSEFEIEAQIEYELATLDGTLIWKILPPHTSSRASPARHRLRQKTNIAFRLCFVMRVHKSSKDHAEYIVSRIIEFLLHPVYSMRLRE